MNPIDTTVIRWHHRLRVQRRPAVCSWRRSQSDDWGRWRYQELCTSPRVLRSVHWRSFSASRKFTEPQRFFVVTQKETRRTDTKTRTHSGVHGSRGRGTQCDMTRWRWLSNCASNATTAAAVVVVGRGRKRATSGATQTHLLSCRRTPIRAPCRGCVWRTPAACGLSYTQIFFYISPSYITFKHLLSPTPRGAAAAAAATLT